MHAQNQQDSDKGSPSRAQHTCRRLNQTSGVRESRVRGGAAIWPNPRGGGGVQRRAGKQSHGARWAQGAPEFTWHGDTGALEEKKSENTQCELSRVNMVHAAADTQPDPGRKKAKAHKRRAPLTVAHHDSKLDSRVDLDSYGACYFPSRSTLGVDIVVFCILARVRYVLCLGEYMVMLMDKDMLLPSSISSPFPRWARRKIPLLNNHDPYTHNTRAIRLLRSPLLPVQVCDRGARGAAPHWQQRTGLSSHHHLSAADSRDRSLAPRPGAPPERGARVEARDGGSTAGAEPERRGEPRGPAKPRRVACAPARPTGAHLRTLSRTACAPPRAPSCARKSLAEPSSTES